MRFVLAIVLFVCAFASIGIGIAQRTFLVGPDSYSTSATVRSGAPLTVVDGRSLSALPGTQFVSATGSGPVFMAYGRTSDVRAWVGGADYNRFRVSGRKLTATVVDGTQSKVPSPRESDLWLDQRSGSRTVDWPLRLPADYSVIIASDGRKAAPASLSIRWPLDNSAPYSGPLIVLGIALLALGLLAFVWALVHARRRRGPRRRPPRLPRPPRQRAIAPRQQRALTAGPIRGRRRGFVALPVLLGGTLLLGGCSSGDLGSILGQPSPSPTPTPTGSAAAAAGLEPVAVTRPQLTRILTRVASTVAAADAGLDPARAAERLQGPALAERTANYALRKADGTQPAERAIPTGAIKVMLPQQNDRWPRTVFAVVADADPKVAPMALMLIQQDPRSDYKAEYAMPLQPNITLPALAPPTVGAPRVAPEVRYLRIAPNRVGAAYYDLLTKGDASASAKLFQTKGDQLFVDFGPTYRSQRVAQLPPSAQLVYSTRAGVGQTIVFSTNNTGAIVAADVDDIETVTPKEPGSAVNPTGKVKLLSGVTQTTKGIVSTYGLQLLFYVPPAADTDGRIAVLGYSAALLSSKEVP